MNTNMRPSTRSTPHRFIPLPFKSSDYTLRLDDPEPETPPAQDDSVNGQTPTKPKGGKGKGKDKGNGKKKN